jgi:hypothetical protein
MGIPWAESGREWAATAVAAARSETAAAEEVPEVAPLVQALKLSLGRYCSYHYCP